MRRWNQLSLNKKIALGIAGGLLSCCTGTTILGAFLPTPAPSSPAPAVTTDAPQQLADIIPSPTRAAAAEQVAASKSAAAEASKLAASERTRQRKEAELEAEEQRQREAKEQRQREARQAEEEARQAEEEAEEDSESAYYANCSAARAAGAAPLYRGDPGYRAGLDRDGDGDACE